MAYQTLGVAHYPDVDMPMVTATVNYDGASPRTMEASVTEVLEEALSTISGIKSMRSDSREGVSQVFLEFDHGRDIDAAAQDVRDKVSAVQSELPTDADAPVVEKLDPDSAPILGIVLAGNPSIGKLSRYADDVIRPRIEGIYGVGGVQLAGDRGREVRIWLGLNDLVAHNLAAQDVIDAIREGNIKFPGGRIEAGKQELVVKTRGKATGIDDFRRLVVERRSVRGSMVAAVTIPATIISTYAFMLTIGFTLDVTTLLALTISVGMIIDDSIVVLETPGGTCRRARAGSTPRSPRYSCRSRSWRG